MCENHNQDLFAHLDQADLSVDTVQPVEQVDYRGQFTNAGAARDFMCAGKATVTLVSKATGARFTYRLRTSEDGNCIFVGLLTGPDNTANYSYIGRIARDVFWAGRKVARPGDIARDAPSVKAFDWSWRSIVRGTLPANLEVWHEGQCGRCGRKLTVPASVARGFGPECAGKV